MRSVGFVGRGVWGCEDVGSTSTHVRCGGDGQRGTLKRHRAFRDVPAAAVTSSRAPGPGRGCRRAHGAAEPGAPRARTVGSPCPFRLPRLPLRRPSWTRNCQNSDTLARWLDGCNLSPPRSPPPLQLLNKDASLFAAFARSRGLSRRPTVPDGQGERSPHPGAPGAE